MSRIQLALNVSDIDAAVEFYSTLFATGPAKRRPGYANFVIATPPLKLVLIETAGARAAGVSAALNHLGIEVETPREVEESAARLREEGLVPDVHQSTTCCYAVQDKAWVSDPDGAPWEIYTVLADADADDTTEGCSTGGCVPAAAEPVSVLLGPGGGVPAPSSSCC